LSFLTLLAYAGIAAQAKFFWYHYGYIVPFMALIGGWGWDRLLVVVRRYQPAPRAAVTAALMAAALVLASPEVWDTGVAQWRGLIDYVLAPQEREQSLAGSFYFYEPEAAVARYLRSRTRPDDTVYVWGFDPLVYLLSERMSASRFLLSFPLMSDWAPRRWQEE